MAAGYRLTHDAQQDLMAIRRYTQQNWGTEQSRKYLQNMRSTLELLAEFPGQGTVRPEVGEGVHCFPYGSHMLYYRLDEGLLIVFAVLHQRMVPMQHLKER